MSLESLPSDLPAPVDDGAADHLVGMYLPSIPLPSTTGDLVDLSSAGSPWAVVYVYPMTGRPDQDLPDGWEVIPGARGCTPQTCAFRDHQSELAALGAEVFGLSVQSTEYQQEMVERLHVGFAVLSDVTRAFGAALRLPTMEAGGMSLYKRLTMIVRGGRIEHVMYPVFPPDRNAADVAVWLGDRLAAKVNPKAAWDERYATAAALYGAEPNQFVARELADMTPRRVLDLGCGQGRNAVWLATRGHDVTAYDLSEVGIAQARELATHLGVTVDFQQRDILEDWEPTANYDLVLLSYIQLPPPLRQSLHTKAMAALAPGGEVFLIAHHADNLEHGVGGPPMPEVLFAEPQLDADFAELAIVRNEKVFREVERDGVAHTAHDILLRARAG